MSSFSTSLSASLGWDFADLVCVRLVTADGFGVKQQIHPDHDMTPSLLSPVEYLEFCLLL